MVMMSHMYLLTKIPIGTLTLGESTFFFRVWSSVLEDPRWGEGVQILTYEIHTDYVDSKVQKVSKYTPIFIQIGIFSKILRKNDKVKSSTYKVKSTTHMSSTNNKVKSST